MHWSTLRCLDAVAKKGHDRLDADLLDALALDEGSTSSLEYMLKPWMPRARQRPEPVPEAWPARERSVVEGS